MRSETFVFCLTTLVFSTAIFSIPTYGNIPKNQSFQTIQSSAGPLSAERKFRFNYRTTIQVPNQGDEFSIHIPIPEDSKWQKIRDISIDASIQPELYHDSKYGNKIARYDFQNLDGRTVKIAHHFTVIRTKRSGSIPSGLSSNPTYNQSFYKKFLDHHPFMETNRKVESISSEAIQEATNYRQKIRGLYNRVMDMMEYEKSGRGWGKGDISYCINVGEGNCTDFHTLFASMARQQNIPSRFIMGFPIPRTKNNGTIGGYHCWAETYVPQSGWFPMDISEADKHSDLTDFYFGSLDADRIMLTKGKNIPLSNGKNVNYLVYPVVEGNDKVKIEKSFSFKNL